MKSVRKGFSQLIREGDTRFLELVVGFLLILLGMQYALGAIGIARTSINVAHAPDALVGMLGTAMCIGGVLKILGAVLNDISLRIAAAIIGSASWLYLILLVILVASPYTTGLWVVLFAQSAWIYTRLSILYKYQGEA